MSNQRNTTKEQPSRGKKLKPNGGGRKGGGKGGFWDVLG
jgi:hypothetical protein